ncbi:MAG: ImmA/IrrE family metallo-endopeptidase [Gemmataceae bacterium]|nr:ImmA/IrrE family metallo-endopeptidase [Gemmataceae bacterium]
MSRLRVEVARSVLAWAVERSGDREALERRFPKLGDWLAGTSQPTFKQLEAFAQAACVPFGYLFLPEPPEEKLPIPDLRTVRNRRLTRPSPNLLDTIYLMQRRQAWLREERIEAEMEPLKFIGSAKVSDDPRAIGRDMRRVVGLADGWAAQIRTWEQAVSELRRMLEEIGIIAVINGIVGNNTRRVLDVEEFRGFAICDQYAPVIFVNGADAKSAQMFTLAHELAHLWLGESALTNLPLNERPSHNVETWCDRAAAEFLVPEQELRASWRHTGSGSDRFYAVARQFKVSPIVAARRAKDLHLIDTHEFLAFYESHSRRELRKKAAAGGGDFYRNQANRVGELFARQVIYAALEGRLSFKEAYSLIGLNGGAFQEYAARLGVQLP